MEPMECQYHNNCGGWCETEEERDQCLCCDCLEAPPAIQIGKSDSIYDLTQNIMADCGFSIEYQDLFNKIEARLWDYFDNCQT